LFHVDRGKLRAKVQQRQAEQDRANQAEAEAIESHNPWYVKLFNRQIPSLWTFFALGYIPSIGVGIAAGVLAPSVVHNRTEEFEPHNMVDDIKFWIEISGLDIYCAPSYSSGVIWYLLPSVFLLFSTTMLVRFKSIQTMRLTQCMRFMRKNEKRNAQAVLKTWKDLKRNSVYGTMTGDLDNPIAIEMKSSSLILLVIFFSFLFNTLQGLFVSGLAIPFGVVSVIQAIILFSMNVGQKYTAIWTLLGDACEKYFPCLRPEDADKSSCSESTTDSNCCENHGFEA